MTYRCINIVLTLLKWNKCSSSSIQGSFLHSLATRPIATGYAEFTRLFHKNVITSPRPLCSQNRRKCWKLLHGVVSSFMSELHVTELQPLHVTDWILAGLTGSENFHENNFVWTNISMELHSCTIYNSNKFSGRNWEKAVFQ